MRILLSERRGTKPSPGLVLAGAALCVPAMIAWVGAALYVTGVWPGGADAAGIVPLWAAITVMSLPVVGGVVVIIAYVRQLRHGHGDWRLLAVMAVAAALAVGTGIATLTLFEPGASPPRARNGGQGAAGGGGASVGSGGRSGSGARPSTGGAGRSRPTGGSRPSSGGGARRR